MNDVTYLKLHSQQMSVLELKPRWDYNKHAISQ